MSTSAIIRNSIFLRRFDLKIKMGITLLLHIEFNELNLFSPKHIKIYNSPSATFYKWRLQVPLLETQFFKRIWPGKKNRPNLVIMYRIQLSKVIFATTYWGLQLGLSNVLQTIHSSGECDEYISRNCVLNTKGTNKLRNFSR